MNLQERYLFADHSKADVRRWCADLRWFRFCRAHGGHANDGDSFQTAIEFGDEAELLALARTLDVSLNELAPDRPRPVPGQPYTAEEFARFGTEIRAFPHLEQPSWQEVFGVRVHLWVEPNQLVLSLMGSDGNLYAVSEHDFENARALERQLQRFNLRFAHPKHGCQCLCAECYPDLLKES